MMSFYDLRLASLSKTKTNANTTNLSKTLRAQGLNEYYTNDDFKAMPRWNNEISRIYCSGFNVWMVKMCNVYDQSVYYAFFIKAAWRHLMLLFHFDWIKERTNFRFNSIIGYFQICQWAFWSVVAKDGKTSLWFYDVFMYLCTECMVPSFYFAFFFFSLMYRLNTNHHRKQSETIKLRFIMFNNNSDNNA